MTRSIILPFIIIVASIAVVLMYTMPAYERVKTLKMEESQLSATLENASRIVSLVDALKLQYDTFPVETREKLQTMLPDVSDPIDAIVEVNNLASGGVVLTDVSVEDDSESSGNPAGYEFAPVSPYNTTEISYTVSSDYFNMLEFIYGLERSLRLTNIEKIELNADSDTGFLDADIVTNTYWLNE